MMDKFYSKVKVAVIACLLMITSTKLVAQYTCLVDPNGANNNTTPVTITKWKPVSGFSVGNNFFKGLLEFLPSDYDPANTTKKYPIIIYIPGVGATGNGSSTDLCKIFNDVERGLPYQLELGNINTDVSFNGQDFKYIIIAPQYTAYNYNTNFYPKAADFEAFLDYVLPLYNVDLSRVYLTGMSSGSNIVIDYVSSTDARAKRVAAFNTASLCSPLGQAPVAANAYEVIAAANLHGRFTHCQNDMTCLPTISENWYNSINGVKPNLSEFNYITTNCRVNGHDSWTDNYNDDLTYNGRNLYNYFIQFDRQATLPVSLKYFNGKMNSGKVDLEWSTSSETSSARFVIERGGGNYAFTEIASIEAAGNSNSNKVYRFTDSKPLVNLNLYRIVQIDQDGTRKISEIVKVMNKNSGKFNLTVSPNPFTTKVSAFVNLDKKQQVKAVVTDLNGRQVANLTRLCNEGTTELSIPVSNLGKGIYLLRIETDSYSEVQKIVRQ
jgi:predicted esterase